nr:hypothetical protein [Tanacetum cinerariifolium]
MARCEVERYTEEVVQEFKHRDPLRKLCHRLIAHTIAGRGQAPEKVTHTDLYFLRSVDQEAVNLSYMLAHYLFRHAEGRKRGAQMFGRHFILRLADHFGLLTKESLAGDDCGSTSATRTMPQRLDRLEEEEVHGIQVSLGEQREVVDVMARDLSRFTVWAAGGISQLLDSARAAYTRYSTTHVPYQRRRVRQRTGEASTLATLLDEDQPNP